MTTPDIRPINKELQKLAKDELNEVESRISEDIEILRTWIKKQPHLKARINDQFLVAFLRGCKYSMEKAKSKVDYFYTIRTMMPELFGDLKMDDKTISFCKTGTYVHLPKSLGEGGARINLSKFSNLDPKIYRFIDLLRFECLLMDWQIHQDDNCNISGYIEIIDLSKMSLSLLAQMEPMLIKKLIVYAEKATPMRLKGVHFINSPKEAQALLSLVRSLMSAKLQQRFYVHKTMEDLYKVIPKENLPLEYGGTNGSLDELIAQSVKELIAFNDYFNDEQQYGVNEKLRPGKRLDVDSLFGIAGSFRKLDID